MDIIRLKPVFKQMIWGGSRMRSEFGYDIPGDDTGECWAVSAHPNGDCEIADGEFAGMKLSALWETKQEIFGNAADILRQKQQAAGLCADEAPVFPLLTKIIDAKQNLSIQVHPDDDYAKEHENGSLGKTECWYVLDCDPGTKIIIGHNAKTHEELKDMIETGRWEEFIREVPVHKGDFFQIEPGTLHAIKGGTMLLETQQNSDITYRVYDYGRLQNGKPRQLHIRQSIDVINVPFEGSEARDKGLPLIAPRDCGKCCTPLVHCKYYNVWRLDIADKDSYIQDKPFLICSVTGGEGRIVRTGEDDGAIIRKGDHFILPAGFGGFTLEGRMQLICSSI
ncbi:MAG: mannose-6-phosphate isomerase, class I [Lachnospiraceae bacterium]|nr:mannose-6-phosphate isomerase, class I [Lachnospiraceae bacterium]